VKWKLANGVDITYNAFYKCTATFRTQCILIDITEHEINKRATSNLGLLEITENPHL